MYQHIGEVYLRSILKQKTLPPEQTVHEKKYLNVDAPRTTNTTTRLREIEIKGYAFNDSIKTRKEYITDLSRLMNRNAAYNRIQLEDIDGYLEIYGNEIRNTEDELNMFILFGKILPKNEHIPYYVFESELMPHTHAEMLSSYVVMPYGVTTVNVDDKRIESIPIPPTCSIITPEGSLPVFDVPNWFTASTATGTGVLTVSDNVLKFNTYVLDQNTEYGEWEIIPGMTTFGGRINVTVNCKIDSAASLVVNVSVLDSTDAVIYTHDFPVTSTSFTNITTGNITVSNFSRYKVRVTKKDATGGLVIVAGIRIEDINSMRFLKFSLPAPNMNKGECKIYDTVTVGQVDKTKWKRVYMPDAYVFTGDVIFENATMQWRVNPTLTWANTGQFYDRISSTSGKLYPVEHTSDKPDMQIHYVMPDMIQATFKFRKVATLKYDVVTVSITPLTVYIHTTPLLYSSQYGWAITNTSQTSIGRLNTSLQSMVMFTPTSSISMIRSRPVTPEYLSNGFYTYNNTTLDTPYSVALSVLPRTTDNTGKLYHNKMNSGLDYYVDGEYIDSTKQILLTDFLGSLYQSGLMCHLVLGTK